jgi:hypothetical protein
MVLSSTSALAIEAKWTEPRYETVSKRLKSRVAKLVKEDPSNNDKHHSAQLAVIQGWLNLLRPHSTVSLSFEDAGDAVYQMIHRAASACATGHRPGLAYLHFEPGPKSAATSAQYRTDLRKLHELLGGPINFPFYLVDVHLHLTEAFREIASLPKGKPDTDRRVRDAIRSTRLFEFGKPKMERIA